MTIPLVPAAGGGPLLTYGLQVEPDPLQAGGPARLNLVVSNALDEPVNCSSIQLSVPDGTSATDLIVSGAAIGVTPADGWTVASEGGVVTLTAPGGSIGIGGAGLVFELATVANDQPGTASIMLTETASDGDDPSEQRSGTFAVDKFPADFSLSDLTFVPADKPEVPYGSPATLNWTATGAGVSCKLEYQPANDGEGVNVSVPNAAPAGGYGTAALTRAEPVTFTLTAQLSVPGRRDPMIRQRQLIVTVESLSLAFTAEPSHVGVNGLVRLTWNAANADKCFLDDEPVALSGVLYRVLGKSQPFTLLAQGSHGQFTTKQSEVTVDPGLKPNTSGWVVTGGRGEPGRLGYVDEFYHHDPQPGGPGGDAKLEQAIPPLAVVGTSRVIPITLTGGVGGTGGAGNNVWPGTDGGPGGDATARLTFDSSAGPPAQYVIMVAAGEGGQPGSSIVSPPPGKGGDGVASLTIDGQAVPLPGA